MYLKLMPCLSKSLFWFGGIGASLILAYGSIYLFYAKNQDQDDQDDDDDETSRTKNVHISTTTITTIDNGSSDTMSDDSSIEIILLYKQIPNQIFERDDCFKQIQLETATIIEEESVVVDNKSIESSINYRNILIQGYHKNVMKASRRIDQLVSSTTNTNTNTKIEFKRFEILSSKLPLITGVNNITINSLAERSGAKILIDQSSSIGDQFTMVDIYGTREQIKIAYNLIDELLNQERRLLNRSSRKLSNQMLNNSDDDDELDSFETFDNDLVIIGTENHPEFIKKQTEPHRKLSTLTMEQITYITETFDVIDDPDRSISLTILPPIQVFVSHIIDPGLFYVQINESKRSARLDELNEDMKKFYAILENQSACKCDCKTIKKNDIIAIKIDDDDDSKFYRGYVLDRLNNNDEHEQQQYKVFYADFGIIAQHSIQSLFYLNGDFLTRLPFQAIRCSLSDIDHINEWTNNEIEQFRQWTRVGLWESVVSIRCHKFSYQDDGQRIFFVEMYSKLPHQFMTINVGLKLLQLHNQH